MEQLPLYNTINYLGGLPIRVSTQAVRDKDFSHFHRDIQLCFVLSGELKHRINGVDYVQTAGSCAFVLPYMSHTLDSLDSDDTPVIVYIWFEENFLKERGYNFCFCGEDHIHFNGYAIPEVCEFNEKKSEAADIIRNIINEFNSQENMSYNKLASLIGEFFHIACTKPIKKKPTKIFLRRLNNINRTVSFINENYPSKINIDDLCKITNMSRRNFTTCFKSFTRRTVKEFILAVRLFYSTQMLFEGNLLFDDIAEQCGLYNHSNLARVFAKYLGSTPTQYATQHNIAISILHQIPLRERYKWLFDEQYRNQKSTSQK